jgi:hypothetical protein
MKKLDIELTIRDEPTPDTRNLDSMQDDRPQSARDAHSFYPSSAGVITPDESANIPHGSVSDLDMNLIIHSFMNEQQNQQPDPFAQDLPYSQNLPMGIIPNMSQIPNADMYSNWGAYEVPPDEEYGDALFGESSQIATVVLPLMSSGFNGAALDGMWQ